MLLEGLGWMVGKKIKKEGEINYAQKRTQV